MNTRNFAAITTVLALAFAGCGGDDASEVSGPATVVPPEMPLYIEATVSPEGTQADNLDALLAEASEIPVLGSVGDPADLIKAQLDSAAAQAGVDFSYDEDVSPWIGQKIGFGVTEDEDGTTKFVAALETDDEDAAKEALDRLLASDDTENPEVEYEGVTYFTNPEEEYGIGVFDGHVVLATKDEFDAAIDASGGDSLADSESLASTFDALDDERLGAVFIDVEGLVEASSSEEDMQDIETFRAVAPEYFESGIALSAGLNAGDQVYFDYVVPTIEGQPETLPSPLLGEAPGDSFGAFAAADAGTFGAFFDELLTRAEESGADLGEDFPEGGISQAFEDAVGVPFDDAMAAIGDLSVYARGDLPDDIEVAGEIEVSDAEVAESMIDALEAEARKEDGVVVGPPVGGSDVGFSALDETPDGEDPFTIEETGDFDGESTGSVSVEASTGADLPFANLEFDGERITYGFFKDEAAAEASDPDGAGTFSDSESLPIAEEALGDEFELLGLIDLQPILDEAVPSVSPEDLLGGSPEDAVASIVADKLGIVAAGVKETDGYTTQRYVLKLAE